MYIVSLTYTRPLQEVDALLEAHIAWLKDAYAAGVFIASGRKVPREGGVILARGERAELDAWLARDPFAVGAVARYDVTEFVPSMTAPGFEVLTTA
ncbi:MULTISPECIES: YciI family protein [unclassified Paludibacterium]|uniref:YciI family protein n=1 Tax=unclassified Paludibacterium TaxID=2618429 RepID=UPI001C04DD89|nr:YciI family protein [Paludibacterium sp. B53371]BEV72335.1 YciI family protein [Paludibacterium sp. THUN1379]